MIDFYVGKSSYSGNGFYVGDALFEFEIFANDDATLQRIVLPVWLNRGVVKRLAMLFDAWWARVEGWLRLPLAQIDPLTCDVKVLDLIASKRNVERFNSEPEWLYRLRVAHAHANAVDAGSVAGIKRIFERLGVGHVDVYERLHDRDWDVIVLELSNSTLSQNQDLLRLLLTKYGRTCRRYEFNLITPISLGVASGEFSHEWAIDTAE